jgi:hypothetical protein
MFSYIYVCMGKLSFKQVFVLKLFVFVVITHLFLVNKINDGNIEIKNISKFYTFRNYFWGILIF